MVILGHEIGRVTRWRGIRALVRGTSGRKHERRRAASTPEKYPPEGPQHTTAQPRTRNTESAAVPPAGDAKAQHSDSSVAASDIERRASAELRTRLLAAENEILSLRLKLAGLEHDAGCTVGLSKALERSTSWRLAAPWRVFRRTASRLERLLRHGSASPLFDRVWYLDHNPDVRLSEIDPYTHYLRHGSAEGRDPNPFFSTSWYLERYPDVRESGTNPLEHFYRHGAGEGRDPHPLFSNAWYVRRQSMGKQDATVGLHPLFDAEWYGASGDPESRETATIEDYLEHGWRQLRSPHPLFSPSYYLERNAELLRAGVEPLTHFMTCGWRESRDPHPLFDVDFYCSQIPDFRSLGIDPLTHYVTTGWKQRRRPHELFDPGWYLEAHGDVAASGQEPLSHYLRAGWKERRRPCAAFDPDSHRGRFGLGSDTVPFIEFATRLREGRLPPSGIDVRKAETTITLDNPAAPRLTRPIGVFVHLYYEGVADEIASYIAAIDVDKKIYVTTDTEEKRGWIDQALARYGLDAETAVVPNCGFDIGPFLLGFPDRLAQHDLCLKLHGKKSCHNAPEFSEGWRHHLLGALVGDTQRSFAIINAFEANPDLGILAAKHWPELAGWLGIGDNYLPMKSLLERSGIELVPGQDIEYPSGSMFWFRPRALLPLFELGSSWSDFEGSHDLRDGTLAHAVERCFFFYCALAGMRWAFLPESLADVDRPHAETAQVIEDSGAFDATYYLARNPDVREAGRDPLEHWMANGWTEGRDPSAGFNTRYYVHQMPAPLRWRVNPLAHYLLEGRASGLRPTRPSALPGAILVEDLYKAYVRAETAETFVEETAPVVRGSDVKLIAFYLPQFHPFAENDEFWGRGFTEWTNTTKALPLFEGHYQPRLPGELGFYDTRLKQILARQIELARQYGIHGFCLHHYFFDGKPVMRAPFDLLLANPDLDIPFCLHWANEPWTVRFDGLSTQSGVLLDQRHSAEDDIAFFRDIEPALHDRRYITVDGRPLLAVYRPSLFPDIRATLDRWRDCCLRSGLREPYMAVMQTGFEGAVDPRKYGFDAAIEFPPQNFGLSNARRRVHFYDPGADAGIFDYEHLVDKALFRPKADYTLLRGIIPDWDCTARRANAAIFINTAPHRYQRWLEGLCTKTDEDTTRTRDEKLVFVNAWNEWAEGAYLEPDRKYGYAYLDATARALNHYRPPKAPDPSLRVAIVAHIYYTDLVDELTLHFRNIPGELDLVITTPEATRDVVLAALRDRLGGKARKTKVLGVRNIGADIGPFLLDALPLLGDYDLCCKVHSKKTPYSSKLAGWREYLLGNLLGSPHEVSAILDAFARDETLGVLYAEPFGPVSEHVEWGSNFERTAALLGKLGIAVDADERPEFPTGSMFWFRPSALAPLLQLGLAREDFEPDDTAPRDPRTGSVIDGTIMHALERSICYVAQAAGYRSRRMRFRHG